jgi:hypothetical protein
MSCFIRPVRASCHCEHQKRNEGADEAPRCNVFACGSDEISSERVGHARTSAMNAASTT